MELQFFMLFGRGVGKWGRISFVGVCFKGNFELIFLGDFIRYLLQKTQEKSNVICLSFLPYVFTKLYQFLATSMLCRCMEKILKFFQEFFILIHALKLSFFHVYFPSFSTIFHFSVNIQLKNKVWDWNGCSCSNSNSFLSFHISLVNSLSLTHTGKHSSS